VLTPIAAMAFFKWKNAFSAKLRCNSPSGQKLLYSYDNKWC